MFLKSELLESNGSSVTLFQLSALQRIEHLEYLKQMEAVEGGDIQAAVTLTVKSGAYLVAMSLWHGHSLKGSQGDNAAAEVAKIQDEVMQTWPAELIAEAEFKVKLLSGMIAPVTDDPEEPGEEQNEQAEPVTAEKPSPAS
ncbi:phage minor tail protein G [Enterobacter cloacae]|jgi:phage minor tail protein G|uniref:phage tail assembly chaperone G n=1 Tax=Enterobacter cloacae complex TaxID=354276 RepID=UPI0005F1C700|nr:MULTISPECIES: phage minor tail protein G [Enterobacter cloacae complex]QLU91699.1 phage minor tail protein G [Enterobacter roggenkampii]DAY90526.1 MAG TPA: tail assembly chaperone [Caudoviricetes sp.]HAT7684894.1 phage minor tail protein G [Enterobacter cloacae subsp. cloacae]HCB1553081.1 phage minor tail protein G [Enterobacter asburiae]HED2450938.1 phage minor tail protein G [Enterobacter hormaechei subsp. hoffmannii]